MPKKEPVSIANPPTFDVTDLRPLVSSVSVACDVINDSFGNVEMSKSATSFLGFAFGFKKVIPYADSHNSQDTAPSKLSKLKTIGLTKSRSTLPTSQRSNTSSMTALTLEKATALSQS
jgi:hypothetical protein